MEKNVTLLSQIQLQGFVIFFSPFSGARTTDIHHPSLPLARSRIHQIYTEQPCSHQAPCATLRARGWGDMLRNFYLQCSQGSQPKCDQEMSNSVWGGAGSGKTSRGGDSGAQCGSMRRKKPTGDVQGSGAERTSQTGRNRVGVRAWPAGQPLGFSLAGGGAGSRGGRRVGGGSGSQG